MSSQYVFQLSSTSRAAIHTAFLVCCILWNGCQQPSSTTDAQQRVRVSQVTYQLAQGGARILTGELENLSDQRIPVAQIDVSLFDANNRKVESMMVLVRDVEPGQSVSFREAVRSKFDIRGARARAVFVP